MSKDRIKDVNGFGECEMFLDSDGSVHIAIHDKDNDPFTNVNLKDLKKMVLKIEVEATN